MRSWKTMESAPMHVDILGYREDAGVFMMCWTSPSEFLSDCQIEQLNITEEDQFYECWWHYGPNEGGMLERDLAPTHWMELPVGPE